MNEIEELIKKYKKEIHNYEKYIDGQWACEFDRISGMEVAVEVLKNTVKDLKQLKESLVQDSEDQREITDKVVAYDQLDHKFKVVCGKGVAETLQRLCAVGFGDEITEKQALNRLANRFPMTTDQIVSTLEMSQSGVTHEPVKEKAE